MTDLTCACSLLILRPLPASSRRHPATDFPGDDGFASAFDGYVLDKDSLSAVGAQTLQGNQPLPKACCHPAHCVRQPARHQSNP
jgi:hypothetical protein